MKGAPASRSGSRPTGGAAGASPAKPSIPSAWTPGPWQLEFTGRNNNEPLIVSTSVTWVDETGEEAPVYVADLHHGGYCFEELGYSNIANARLIASAPELYEAAQTLLEFWEQEPNGSVTVRAAIRLGEALAKARGQ